MPVTTLPAVTSPAQTGHESDHATLKIDYDIRHPDAPLPELGGGVATHEEIHILLRTDHNAISDEQLPTGDITAWTLGHTKAHNILHTAHNERH